MGECEWDDDLPGAPCGTDDHAAEATTMREIAWSNRIWGGEGEDWVEKTALCDTHAKALDDAIAAREQEAAEMPEKLCQMPKSDLSLDLGANP